MQDSTFLRTIHPQEIVKQNDIFIISYEKKMSMSFKEFKQKSCEIFKNQLNLSLKQRENYYWNTIVQRSECANHPTPIYSISNNWSLFNSAQKWNLSNLSYKDSFIQPVIKFYVLLVFIILIYSVHLTELNIFIYSVRKRPNFL